MGRWDLLSIIAQGQCLSSAFQLGSSAFSPNPCECRLHCQKSGFQKIKSTQTENISKPDKIGDRGSVVCLEQERNDFLTHSL